MVKLLDEEVLLTIDHIGAALVLAAQAWKTRFASEMARRGFPWHAEARGQVLAHLGPTGRSQTELVSAMGVSKQAVQQLLDQLEADGVIARTPDPKDKRARRVELTNLGLADFAERNRVKQDIEREFEERVGRQTFETLKRALSALAA